ncbi:uncharacterized protein LOC114532010 isoform X2 [Dendronephthya gigantea]|uniref:uncharacterized protein LOC114532010 isoform X2 n=1 Tax=Dendronephthya gigantea TaxID=151771 RepID=UPI00106D1D2E|nr:uncharacterized protein LOC114532010 isoform X2 [Dendronephthya gigantea]
MSHHKGDIFRVFAYENNTVVKNAYGSKVLSPGTYTELILDKNLTSFINCSKRCQVVQYIIGKTIGGRYADPSMIVLPSIKQFLPYYRVMASYASTYFSSVTITIEKRYTNGLYFDEVQMSNLTWLKVTGTNYVWTVVGMAGTKVATVYHSSPAVKFGLLVFGWYYSDSYAYPGGFALDQYNKRQEQAHKVASKMATFRDKLTNYGNEFVVGFTSLYRSASGGQIGIAIVAHFDTNITIKTESVTKSLNVTFHMKEGEFLQYNLPLSLRMNGKQSNGVFVSSTESISVTCLDYRYSSYGGDGYLALPTYALGIIYVVASYQPYDYYSRAKIGIVAVHERTNVLFKLNKNAVIAYNGISYNYGSPFHISLSKLQSVQLESVSDLSGSMIFASKPITVISTVDLGRPGSGNSDKLATLLLPVTQWGKQYILTTVGSMSHHKGDIFRVFAFENNTVVKNAYGSQLLSPGTYTELILDKNLTSFINCSKRCQVVQYIIGKIIGGRYADPSMIVLPSIKQFLPYYRVMASYTSTYFSSVTITIEKRYTNGLYFDEVQMSNLTWLKVTGTNYVWTVVGMAGTKVATVYHSSPAVKFGLLVFGWYYSDSYAYPGGFALDQYYTKQAHKVASKMTTFRDKLTNYGNEFVVGFTSLYRSASGGQIGIAIVAHFDTNITIKTESVTKSLNVTFHMKEGEFLKYNLPLSLRMNGKQSNGVFVSSTRNISVTCLDYRYSSYGGDGYLALPTYALGIIYVVASYKPYDYYSRAKIGIVAAHERTNVLFKLNKNAVIVYNGISYNYGNPFHISLSKLQSVQLESRSDLSGSMIFASKPITVISSVDLGRPGSGNSDKLATLLLPVTQWGKQYILATVGSMSHHKGDIFRVFAYENNTVVKNAYGSKLLSPGTYTELILDKNLTSFINCSKRCQVVQYIIGKTIGGRYADPSMIVLPSIKQFLPYYRVMASYASTYFSSVTIMIEKRYTNGLYFDEVQMSNLTWLKVTGTNYVWTVVGMAGTKVATVYHSSPAVKFGLLVFGWYYSDSCAYPGGFAFKHSNIVYNCSNLGCNGNFVCKKIDGYLTCACSVGFTGENCEQPQEVDCRTQGCEENYECRIFYGQYTCVCQGSFIGANCTRKTEIDCRTQGCEEDYICRVLNDQYTCVCQNDYTRTNCSEDTEVDCRSSGCEEDYVCRVLNDQYTCVCQNNYTRTNCSEKTEIDCRSYGCGREYVCRILYGRYTCVCHNNYTSTDCTKIVGQCTSTIFRFGINVHVF